MNFRDRFHTWSEFGLEYLIADILVQPENEQRHADYDIFLLLCHATDWLQNAEMLHFDNDSPVGEIEDLVFVMKSHWWKGLRNWLAHPLRERLPKVMLFRHPLASSISPQKWNLNYRNGSVTPVIWEDGRGDLCWAPNRELLKFDEMKTYQELIGNNNSIETIWTAGDFCSVYRGRGSMESYRNRLAVASHPTTGERASPAVLDRLIRSIWYLMSELRLKDAIGVPVPNKPSMLLAAIDQYDAAEILINNWLIDVEQQYPRLAIRMRLAGPESTVTARQSIAGESQPPGSVRISYDAVRKAVILDGEVIWMPDDDCAVRNASVS